MGLMMRGVRRIRVSLFERPSVKSIRNGIIMILPIMLSGSVVTLLQSMPITVYQNFLQEFRDGIINAILTWAADATFGMLAIYITVAVSYCYIQELVKDSGRWSGPVITSLVSYTFLSGMFADGFNAEMLGEAGMFTAIVSALLATKLYYKFECWLGVRIPLYADGMDAVFSNAWTGVPPFLFVTTVMWIFNVVINFGFKMSGLQEIFRIVCDWVFSSMSRGNSFLGGLLFVFVSTGLWFFGVHGSNVLMGVIMDIITPATIENMEVASAGGVPSNILTNNFFDFFVNIGGSGACICLTIAVLLFSKRKGNRRLAAVALPTVLFNISELVVFGLPVVFNPVMVIPFMLTPVVTYIISYIAFATGLIPAIHTYTVWAMPVFVSGYISTESVYAIILQAVNICVGTLVYYPFIKILDRQGQQRTKDDMQCLIRSVKEYEVFNRQIKLVYLPGTAGMLAKSLGNDLKQALEKNTVSIFYQPQYNNEDKCIGAEALLRWNHPGFGMMYPPLVIKLAEEFGILLDLEKYIFESVARDAGRLREEVGAGNRICVNISADTLLNLEFKEFLKELVGKYDIREGSICIEVNEQTTLMMDDETVELFAYFKKLGFANAIDDFSMGHTSLKCLQSGQFDVVKLDGELVKGIARNQFNQNIIESILHLSKSMDFDVLAEYVETREQQKALEEIDCNKYQGYLYSPAVPIDEFVDIAKNSRGTF